MTSTIMVTGGTGLVGAYTVKRLVERGDDVVVYDITPPRNPKMRWVLEDVWDKVTFVEGNIDDLSSLLMALKENKVEKICHMAAIFRPAWERIHPYYSLHISVMGTVTVLEAARVMDLGRVVFAGTVGEYAHGLVDYSTEPLDEVNGRMFDPSQGPIPYSAGKRAASIIGMCYYSHLGVDWINARFSRVWGFGAKKETSGIEVTMIENAVDGIPTRMPEARGDVKKSHTYAKDLARGLLLALDVDGDKLTQRTFNIAGDADSYKSDIELANLIQELIPEAVIELGRGGVSRRLFSIKAAREQLGFEPEYDFRRIVTDYIDMYREFKNT